MVDVTPVPDRIVIAANKRIQRKLTPIFRKIKATRAKAQITARNIIIKC